VEVLKFGINISVQREIYLALVDFLTLFFISWHSKWAFSGIQEVTSSWM